MNPFEDMYEYFAGDSLKEESVRHFDLFLSMQGNGWDEEEAYDAARDACSCEYTVDRLDELILAYKREQRGE